jgi:hypothetical protein
MRKTCVCSRRKHFKCFIFIHCVVYGDSDRGLEVNILALAGLNVRSLSVVDTPPVSVVSEADMVGRPSVGGSGAGGRGGDVGRG